MDMKTDPRNEDGTFSPQLSAQAHASLGGPRCLTPENRLNIFNSIADQAMLLDNDYTIPGCGTRVTVTLPALAVACGKES